MRLAKLIIEKYGLGSWCYKAEKPRLKPKSVSINY